MVKRLVKGVKTCAVVMKNATNAILQVVGNLSPASSPMRGACVRDGTTDKNSLVALGREGRWDSVSLMISQGADTDVVGTNATARMLAANCG